ncbi:MAG: hypothetical protein AABX44_01720, partial [Nanoarchaeota archaeon]
RKILSKLEQEKKRKRNSRIIGVILMIVMFGSVFGIVVSSFGQNSSGNNKIEYNGYKFFNENGLWKVSAGEINFIFKYSPTQTKNITTNLKKINNYYNKPLYVSSEDLESEIEVYKNLQQIASRIQPACFNNETCEGDFPIKTCSDNFIIIVNGTEEITQVENCVYIKGEKQELSKLTDSFLYNIVDIK